ncbi:flagellar protein FlgN [Thermincola potens]|uniref:FlgN family protein n=1 Tax=Thermincola potens (strain JR) TaxID=635013 RepID=D5XCV5_THEPJ|nr:flagellar protein FlgN [Thermincola potens]ADG83631.1 FlgN family protein [Thermincola potens JR]
MLKLAEELIAILQEQLDLYTQLLNLARAKRPVLVKGKIEELDGITKQEEAIIFQVGRLEGQRNRIHQALANHFALSPANLTATELEKRLDADAAARLRCVFDKMVNIFAELEKENKTNTELIEHSLEYVNFYLNILSNTDTSPSYNDNDKDRKNEAPARIFDQKI